MEVYDVEITATAEADIEQAFQWWAENRSVEQSLRWYAGVQNAIATLTELPHRCPLIDEAFDLQVVVHQLLFGIGSGKATHRILFKMDEKRVTVLRVLHTSLSPLTNRDQLG